MIELQGKYASAKVFTDVVDAESISQVISLLNQPYAADSRRSLGLGLSLCRSIIHAHGGSISVRDNHPSGAIFEFTLPSEEVSIHE